MQVNISDLLDNMEAPDVGLAQQQGVSAERIKEIAMKKIRADKTPKTVRRRRPGVIILAAALALALSITALAAYHNGFFKNVFGTGVKGQEAHDVVLSGEGEGLDKVEHFPAVERVDVDAEKAEALVGAYVTEIGKSIKLGNYTFTLENMVLDENGIGALTVHVENPDGHGIRADGKYDEGKGEYTPFSMDVERKSGEYRFMDSREYLAEKSFTDTQADYVIYVTPFETLPTGENLSLRVQLHQPEKDPPEWPTASIQLPTENQVSARSFSADGVRADVSPVGMKLSYDIGTGVEKTEDAITVRYADGTEYVVLGTDLHNLSVHSVSSDYSNQWIAFNRLADMDNITDIAISGHWIGEDGVVNTYDLVLK